MNIRAWFDRWLEWVRRRRLRRLLAGLQVSERWLGQHRREAHFDRHWEE